MTPERLRQLALELPDVQEEVHAYGTYFRVRGHQMAAISADQRTVNVFVSAATARARVKLDRGVNLLVGRPRGEPGKGVRMTLAALSDEEMRSLLREAWQLVPATWCSPPDYSGGRRPH